MRAKDIMSTPVITASPETPLKRIVEMLVERDIAAVPIVDEIGDLVGIVTEADVVGLQSIPDPRRHVLSVEPKAGRIPEQAKDVMTTHVVCVSEDEDVTRVAKLILDRRVKHIPVVSGRKVTGIISRHDILKVLARSDSSIQTELQERLDDEITLLGWFHANVDDGVVTLIGPKEKGPRRLARLLARSIPGVVAVRFEDEP